MRAGDIIGLIVLLAVVGFGGYYLLKKQAPAGPAGSAPQTVPANEPQQPNAPPQPSQQSTVSLTGDQLLAQTGINAGKDVLLAGIKGIFG